MYKRLKYYVEFAQPRKVLQGEIFFEEGMTGIVGQNGKGKSLILEMIQYAEFGSAALRGKADTYLKLAVELDWLVNDVPYSVERSGSTVRLSDASGPIATGTKPVNAKIAKIHGYSYDVFKVANLAAQGDIESLGKMLPSERKRMVDETIGLKALDALTDFVQKNITTKNAAVNALEPLVVLPIEPVKPEGLLAMEFYELHAKALMTAMKRKAVLQAEITKPLTEPLKAELQADDANLPVYEKDEAERQRLMSHATLLIQQKNVIPSFAEAGDVQLHPEDAMYDTYRAQEADRQRLLQNLQNVNAELSRLQVPKHSIEDLEKATAANVLYKRWSEKQALIAKRVPHDCPACKHHWEDEDPRIAAEYSDVTEEPTIIFTDAYIKGQMQLVQNIERVATLTAGVAKLEVDIATSFNRVVDLLAIEEARAAFLKAEKDRTNKANYERLEAELAKVNDDFTKLPDNTDAISFIKAARINVAEYTKALAAYAVAKASRDEAFAELSKIAVDLEQQSADNTAAQRSLIEYETNQKNYLVAKEKYETLVLQLEGYKAEALDWKAGKEAVVALRARIKGYIVPALNSVASKLLSEMTGGELSWVVVSDNFDITVEGQALETLSGAGKCVANLSLRIALGQVLTHKAFPVLLLDEIDASMDNNRARYVAECLRRLTTVFKQILLVSHKQDLEADQFIRL